MTWTTLHILFVIFIPNLIFMNRNLRSFYQRIFCYYCFSFARCLPVVVARFFSSLPPITWISSLWLPPIARSSASDRCPCCCCCCCLPVVVVAAVPVVVVFVVRIDCGTGCCVSRHSLSLSSRCSPIAVAVVVLFCVDGTGHGEWPGRKPWNWISIWNNLEWINLKNLFFLFWKFPHLKWIIYSHSPEVGKPTSFKFCRVTAEHSSQLNCSLDANCAITAGSTVSPRWQANRRSDCVPTSITVPVRIYVPRVNYIFPLLFSHSLGADGAKARISGNQRLVAELSDDNRATLCIWKKNLQKKKML